MQSAQQLPQQDDHACEAEQSVYEVVSAVEEVSDLAQQIPLKIMIGNLAAWQI
jgi:hypothetical protein